MSQLYRLENRWESDEWPLELTTDQIHELNEVSPRGYHYARDPGPDDAVELYEYIGERSEVTRNDD